MSSKWRQIVTLLIKNADNLVWTKDKSLPCAYIITFMCWQLGSSTFCMFWSWMDRLMPLHNKPLNPACWSWNVQTLTAESWVKLFAHQAVIFFFSTLFTISVCQSIMSTTITLCLYNNSMWMQCFRQCLCIPYSLYTCLFANMFTLHILETSYEFTLLNVL